MSDLFEGDVNHLLSDKQFDLGLARSAQLIADMARGCLQFHMRGFIHGDVTPNNFLYVEDEAGNIHLKLTDFGLSWNELM